MTHLIVCRAACGCNTRTMSIRIYTLFTGMLDTIVYNTSLAACVLAAAHAAVAYVLHAGSANLSVLFV